MKCNLPQPSMMFNGKKISTRKTIENTNQTINKAIRNKALNCLGAYALGSLLAAGVLSSCTKENDNLTPPIETVAPDNNTETSDSTKIETPEEETPPIIPEDNEIGMNGFIDKRVLQGPYSNYCYVLAPVISTSNNNLGAKILSEKIKINDDCSVELFDKSNPLHRKYSKEDILKADSIGRYTGKYSTGDRDALPIQMLMNELYENSGGNAAVTFNILTNLKASNDKAYPRFEPENIIAILKNASKKPNKLICFSLDGGKNYEAECIDGKKYTSDLTGLPMGHICAISNIKDDETGKTVTIIDPRDSSEKYEMTWDEFAVRINPQEFSSVDLTPLKK